MNKRRLSYTKMLLLAVASMVGCLMALRIYVARQWEKAEQLEREVLKLKPGSATLPDVQRLVSIFGAPGDYMGSCDIRECYASMGGFIFNGHLYVNRPPIERIFSYVGIRGGAWGGVISVKNGIVEHVVYHASVARRDGSWLSVNTHLVRGFDERDRCVNAGLRRHPEYAIEISREDGGSLVAGVGSGSTQKEIDHASSINFACMTRWRSCNLSEIMPLAYADWIADERWVVENAEAISRANQKCSPDGLSLPERWTYRSLEWSDRK